MFFLLSLLSKRRYIFPYVSIYVCGGITRCVPQSRTTKKDTRRELDRLEGKCSGFFRATVVQKLTVVSVCDEISRNRGTALVCLTGKLKSRRCLIALLLHPFERIQLLVLGYAI